MDTLAAIQFLQENYEQVDPSYGEAPLMWKMLQEPADTVFEYLMAPELDDGPELRSQEEWKDLVQAETNPFEAGKLIIEWVRSRHLGQQDARSMQEYLASPQDQRQHESEPNLTSPKTPLPAKYLKPSSPIMLSTDKENEAYESAITGKPYPFELSFKPRGT